MPKSKKNRCSKIAHLCICISIKAALCSYVMMNNFLIMVGVGVYLLCNVCEIDEGIKELLENEKWFDILKKNVNAGFWGKKAETRAKISNARVYA